MDGDKRVVYVELYGRWYPLCLTVMAHQKICEAWGGLEQMAKAMDTEGEMAIPITAKLLHIMMEGGNARIRALAWMDGEEVPDLPRVPGAEILSSLLVLEDIGDLQEQVFAAVRASKSSTVEAEPPALEKNGETTL